MALVIPQVRVPMNFAIQFLGSPSHSNLKFLLESGEELLANSMIISFNSPVVEKLTTDLFQSIIEVQDFSKEAVQCFLEASYSGKVEKLCKSNLRDVNKMSHVFDVAWLVERCFKFFKSLTNKVDANNYEDQLYLFEEAMFMQSTLKKRNFVELVIKKFASNTSYTKNFVTKYLVDLPSCSTTCLDVMIDITAKEEHILIKILTDHLENNNCILNVSTRYILEKLAFTSCQPLQQLTYRELIEKLECVENPTGDDYKLIVGILKRSNDALCKRRKIVSETNIPNLFHGFEQLQNIIGLHTLVDFLTDNPAVTNSFIFYDAIYSWLLEKVKPVSQSFEVADNVIEKYSAAFKRRGWNPLPLEFVNRPHDRMLWRNSLTSKILKETSTWTNKGFNRFVSAESYLPDEMFSRDHDIFFEVEGGACSSESQKQGKCGFILRVTAASGNMDDSFNIQLVTDRRKYPDDVNFHKEFISSIQNCHFTFDLIKDGTVVVNDTPVSWYGRPQLDATGKFWCWGPWIFYGRKEGGGELPIPAAHKSLYKSLFTSSAKITPVVYITR